MWSALKEAFESKKAWATAVGIGLAVARSFGAGVPAEVLYLLASYVVGQGIADIGKPAAKVRYAQPIDTLRAIKE